MSRSRISKCFYSENTKYFYTKLYHALLLAIPLSLLSGQVTAQIIPDNTLPNNSSIAPNGNSLTINGGTSAGSNLFHSFSEFSLPTGSEAVFNNASNIQNIFSRVTGGKISNIDGLIRANGTANLFFINPSGIIFGPNARLNIGGSFIGSTGNSIQFSDGNSFSATNPQAPPLLTVNVPVGLQVGANPGAIRVEGVGHGFTVADIRTTPINRSQQSDRGLEVKSGNTLALVGGDVNLSGGVLKAPEGQIALGSISSGVVSLIPTDIGWKLGYQGVESFRDINLSGQAAIDASGLGRGSIQMVGREVRLTDGSIGLIQNQGSEPAGDLIVNATELLQVTGTNSQATFPSLLINENLKDGAGGKVAIATSRLLASDGGGIGSRTFGTASTGDVSVSASDTVNVNGFSNRNPNLYSFLSAATAGAGNAGNLAILAQKITALDGGIITTSSTATTGKAGNITINASESLTISGIIPINFLPAAVSSATVREGNAGTVTINTSRLIVTDGGTIITSTLAKGSGGTLIINASDSIQVSGKGEEGGFPSRIESAALIVPQPLRRALGLPDRPSGNSGNIIINTPRLTISDGARVSVANQGTGLAGNLNINAREIILNQGSLTASTASGSGGNIKLQVSGDTILRNGSQIAAEAAGTGDGGNLIANTNTLTILEGSKVTANAFQGNGGNIRITTQGLFTSPDSAITASSSFGVSGTISINNPNLDPSSGLVQLPENVVDPSTQIAQGCAADGGNTFTIAGRGGLPEEPTAT
ncbi:filamentous hemagglutinin N-terminal domain-containing protein, partial [Kamptonema animale CS-326]|uniref:two-partner secretion domain-containing protein n=1 Tax=Kamptonema animale TaxID=92934 RepID=UPI00232B4F5A